MATPFSVIKELVLKRLNRTDLDNIENEAAVNASLRRVQRMHNFRAMEAEATISFVASTADYPLATVAPNYKESRFIKNPTTNFSLIQVGSLETLRRRPLFATLPSDTTGDPAFYYIGPTNLSVYPTPTDASTSTHYFWQFLANLSDPDDRNWFTDNIGEEVLVPLACSELSPVLRNDERIDIWEKQAFKHLHLVIDNDMLQRRAEDTVPGRLSDLSFRLSR